MSDERGAVSDDELAEMRELSGLAVTRGQVAVAGTVMAGRTVTPDPIAALRSDPERARDLLRLVARMLPEQL